MPAFRIAAARLAILLVPLLLPLLPTAPASARPPFPDGGTERRLDFDIVRQGDSIGSHSLVFSRRQGVTEVGFTVSVRVRILGLLVYRYDQSGTETWEGDRLVSLAAETDDNGTRHTVRAERRNDRIRVSSNGEVSDHPDMPTLTLWRALPPHATQVLDPSDGKPVAIAATDLGWESVTVRGRTVKARRWRWEADMLRHVWYDEAGTLLQVHVKGSDGSDIHYLPRTATP